MKQTFRPFVRHSSSGASRIVRDDYAGRGSGNLGVGASFAAWKQKSREIMERDEYKCIFCSSTENLEVHHITPLSRGGTTSNSNLATICSTCHDIRHPHLVVGKTARRKF